MAYSIVNLKAEPSSGGATGTSGTSIAITAAENTGTEKKTGSLTVTSSPASSVITINVTQEAADKTVDITSSAPTWTSGDVGTKPISGTSNSDVLTFSFSNSYFKANSGTTIQYTVTPVSGSVISNATSGNTITGTPGKNAKYNWTLLVKPSQNSSVSTQSNVTTLTVSDGTHSKTINLTQTNITPWLKVNGGTSAVNVNLTTAGAQATGSPAPVVTSNTEWNIKVN